MANETITQTSEMFIGGVNSLLMPSDIPKNQYAWSYNTLNRGGIVQTRPGLTYRGEVVGNKLQGFCMFKPKRSEPRALIAVDGKIWVARPPYHEFTILEGVSFDPESEVVNFQVCLKSVERQPDGSLKIIEPYRLVVIQDGVSRAGFWDGTNARHLSPENPFLETPTGLWMAWSCSRLWVGQGSRLYASDIADPLSFAENQYLAERSSFELPDNITGMIETADQRALLVFTDFTTTSFQSNIRERTQWQTTPDFQRIILPSIGCVSGFSPVNQYGLTHWFSRSGWINIDAAIYSQRSSQLVTTDGEMMRSKRRLSPNPNGICSTAYENLLLISVPSGEMFHNNHTWVYDQSPIGQAGNGTGGVWASVWTGIRPFKWDTAVIGGKQRCFCAAYDKTSKNDTRIHFWEAFDESREDNEGGRILCSMETGAFQWENKCKFKYAEIEVVEIYGKVDLKVYMSTQRGPWIEVMSITLNAEKGSIGSAEQKFIESDSIIQEFKTQTRILRTKDFNNQGISCSAESSDAAGIDTAHSLLFEWRGRMGVHKITVVVNTIAQSGSGKCEPTEAGEVNIITESGETI